MCSLEDADEYSDVWNVEMRKARKPWQCEECRRWIAAGEQYRYISSLYDHHWSTFRICRHCIAAARWLDLVCGGYLTGILAEDLKEHWDESHLYRSVWLGRAIIGIHRRWDGMDPLPDPLPVLRRRGVELHGGVAA